MPFRVQYKSPAPPGFTPARYLLFPQLSWRHWAGFPNTLASQGTLFVFSEGWQLALLHQRLRWVTYREHPTQNPASRFCLHRSLPSPALKLV